MIEQDDKDKPRDTPSKMPQTKRMLVLGGVGSLAVLAASFEKLTTIPIEDVLDAVGNSDKQDELTRRMCENIRRESGR